jgi:hypothetical protein
MWIDKENRRVQRMAIASVEHPSLARRGHSGVTKQHRGAGDGTLVPERGHVGTVEVDTEATGRVCRGWSWTVAADLYGVTPVEKPIGALGSLGPGDVVLVKGSLVAGLQPVAERLAAGAEVDV